MKTSATTSCRPEQDLVHWPPPVHAPADFSVFLEELICSTGVAEFTVEDGLAGGASAIRTASPPNGTVPVETIPIDLSARRGDALRDHESNPSCSSGESGANLIFGSEP